MIRVQKNIQNNIFQVCLAIAPPMILCVYIVNGSIIICVIMVIQENHPANEEEEFSFQKIQVVSFI